MRGELSKDLSIYVTAFRSYTQVFRVVLIFKTIHGESLSNV